MKRVIAVIMSMLLILSMSACGKSKEEKELEKARQEAKVLQEYAKSAQQEYEDLKNDIEIYKAYQSILENAD